MDDDESIVTAEVIPNKSRYDSIPVGGASPLKDMGESDDDRI